jgi:hypothetical protein
MANVPAGLRAAQRRQAVLENAVIHDCVHRVNIVMRY